MRLWIVVEEEGRGRSLEKEDEEVEMEIWEVEVGVKWVCNEGKDVDLGFDCFYCCYGCNWIFG